MGWASGSHGARVPDSELPHFHSQSAPKPQKDGGKVTELKKIIERQNAHIQEQNAEIRALMSKIEKLAGSAGSNEARPQEGPTVMANVAEDPRKVLQRRSPPPLDRKERCR